MLDKILLFIERHPPTLTDLKIPVNVSRIIIAPTPNNKP